MFTRSPHKVLYFPALAALVLAIGGCGSSATSSAPSSTAAVVSPSSVGTAAAPSSTEAAAVPATALFAFTGYVQQIYSTGDFMIDDGQVTYTIVMSPATSVVNLRGAAIPRQAIVVSGSVKVTGTLADSKISALTVLVPTRKDGRDP